MDLCFVDAVWACCFRPAPFRSIPSLEHLRSEFANLPCFRKHNIFLRFGFWRVSRAYAQKMPINCFITSEYYVYFCAVWWGSGSLCDMALSTNIRHGPFIIPSTLEAIDNFASASTSAHHGTPQHHPVCDRPLDSK